jgi:cytochrome c oxidase assembly protein subunit 15
MTSIRRVRRFGYAALGLAYLHLVFGAWVRISGSGMGCGDTWPRCYGRIIPDFTQLTQVIEVSHRYLASLLILASLALVVVAYRARNESGIGGRGGALRPAVGALVAVVLVALLGMYTVKVGNLPFATVLHFSGAMTVLALFAATVIRSGGMGGASATPGSGSSRTMRGALAAAWIAFAVVAMGGVTAKYPGASVGCLSFPLCGEMAGTDTAARHIQLTHRTLAFLLAVHLLMTTVALRKRAATEASAVLRAGAIAAALVVLQLGIAGAMIGMKLPAPIRSMHEAVGVAIWLATFAFAYLARRAAAPVIR